MKLSIPLGLNDAARTLGVTLPRSVSIDPSEGLGELVSTFGADAFGEDFWGDVDAFGADPIDSFGAEFGFSLPGPFKKAVKKVVIAPLRGKAQTPAQKAAVAALAKAPMKVNVKQSLTGLGKGVATGISVASFVVPGVGPLVGTAGLSALAAADKVLADPRVKNATKVIKTTQGMAALGDVPAQRGAATLAAAAKIRAALKVPPGQPAIPLQTNAQRAAVAAVLPQTVGKVTAKSVQNAASVATRKRPSWWDKVLGFFHLARKSAA